MARTMGKEDRKSFLERREADIKDEGVRAAVLRWTGKLGCLLGEDGTPAQRGEWAAFVAGRRDNVPASFAPAMEAAARGLRAERDALRGIEHDSGSSSPSDSSDTDTSSSDDEESGSR